MFPKISVIITCYNEEHLIGQAIDSVFKQTSLAYVVDILVVDDGSKDGSKEVILERAKENPIVKYIYQENKGLPSARNTAIEAAKGDYIAILDGDDLWVEEKLSEVIEAIKQFPDVGLFYSDYYKYLDTENKLIPIKVNSYHYNDENLLFKFIAKGGPIIPSAAVIKIESFRTVGFFDPVFKKAQDTDMWLRIATQYPFQHIEKYLVKKREVTGSLGSNTLAKAQYYKMALDKIEKLVPAVAPYRRQREIIINYKIGLYFYHKNEWRNAREQAFEALKKNKKYFKAYALIAGTLLKPIFKIDIFDSKKAIDI